jgi:6-phosphofructokinase 1
MSSITGISHLTIAAPNLQLYKAVIEFYISLGFKTVSGFNNDALGPSTTEVWPTNIASETEDNSETPIENSEKSVSEECWLYLKTNQEFNDIKIRVVLSIQVDFAVAEFTATYEKKLKLLSTQQIQNEAAFLSLISNNLDEVEQTFKKLGQPFCKHSFPIVGSDKIYTQIFVYDPLLNLIVFDNKETPLTDAIDEGGLDPEKFKALNISTEAVNIARTSGQKKKIGIMTSGGDSSGMNCAVRATVRCALARGCIPYLIFEGYQGLVDGGDKIRKAGWDDVRGLMSLGGTVIGTARCLAFKTKEGRTKAALNLIKNGIDALVVVGGDGSLTGADLLRAEWKSLVEELRNNNEISEEEAEKYKNLTIVGMVGSIDNDMAATDLTIGANTSLHRICEALDSLVSTAISHQRCFVVEVMGRHCGWLGLMAAIAVGADWTFLPERPPPINTTEGQWEDEMCEILQTQRDKGNRKNIIVVCEGAIDRQLNPIKASYVKEVIEKRLGLDTRVTTLGHVQRGGAPSAYDRYLATIQSDEAIKAVLKSTPETPSPMIGIQQNKITTIPLMEAVSLTHSVSEAVSKKDFNKAMELRDPDFKDAYNAYVESTLYDLYKGKYERAGKLRIGIMHVGAPAGGMNAATRTAVRLCLNRGHIPIGIYNGFTGLAKGQVETLSWQEVGGWTTRGGSELGTNRVQPLPINSNSVTSKYFNSEDFIDAGIVAYNFQKLRLQGLIIIGGFEAYSSILTLAQCRSIYPSFCIPMVQIPATVSNNVPGTEYSLGSDTAINAIVEACDRIKLSASASRKRVFVVEVQGGHCGYLAVVGGLAAGATCCYIPEEGITLDMLQRDIRHMIRRYREEDAKGIPSEGRLILRNECASKTYTTDVISAILKEEGKGLFDSRTAVLGHLQQGGIPTPLDRIRAVRQAVKCVDWIEQRAFASINKQKNNSIPGTPQFNRNQVEEFPNVYTADPESACVIGIRGAETVFTPVESLAKETDMKHRVGKKAWWMGQKKLIYMLSKYDYFDEEEEEEKVNLLKNRNNV